MLTLIEPLLRKMVPLLGSVVAGAFVVGLPLTLGAVASGHCETFRGTSDGNDPSQLVVFSLCRRGDRLEGIKTSEGEAGRSVYVLDGTILNDNKIQMHISSVLEDKPAEGWISCADDVFNLTWDAEQNVLVGNYVSVECEDRASLRLEVDRPEDRRVSCGS